ncbi:DoxX family protein (plasmid) [Coraliomargarita sp. W4R53]
MRAKRSAPAGTVAGVRAGARWLLAGFLIFAGVSHLTWGRRGFRITVPGWATKLLRTDKDMIVIASGVVEVMLGAALVVLPADRSRVGALVATFFAAVMPGNVHQWRTGRDAPMMRTDRARFIRLFLQAPLIAWALWCTTTRAPEQVAGK